MEAKLGGVSVEWLEQSEDAGLLRVRGIGPFVLVRMRLAISRLRRGEACIAIDERSPEYIPTPEQIREECERMQATWTEEERITHIARRPGVATVRWASSDIETVTIPTAGWTHRQNGQNICR